MLSNLDPARVTDIILIRQISELYAKAFDESKPEILEEIFTEDAVFQSPNYRTEGRANIRALPDSVVRNKPFIRSRHYIHNQRVEFDGDTARATTYGIAKVLRARDGKTVLDIMAMTYHDSLIKRDGRWRFAERRGTLDWSEVRDVSAPES